MALLKMMTELDNDFNLIFHAGIGMRDIPNDHLEIMVEFHEITGVNLLIPYKDVITWSNDHYVDYALNNFDLNDKRKIVSNVLLISDVGVINPDIINKALHNLSKITDPFRYGENEAILNIRKRASGYTGRKSVRKKVFKIHGKSCLLCGSVKHLTLDHIVPVSEGGKNEINNLQPLCRRCNSSKGTKTIDYRINK